MRIVLSYSAKHGISQRPVFSNGDPWAGAIDEICHKLKTKKNMLMRLGCNSQGGSRGLDLSVARTVVQSLALSVALQNTEVFLMGQDCQRISTVLNDIYRNLLNVPKCTPLAGLFRELGLVSFQIRARSVALRFWDHLTDLSDNFIARKVFDILSDEVENPNNCAKTLTYGNSVRDFLQPLADEVTCFTGGVSKNKARLQCLEYMSQAQQSFYSDAKSKPGAAILRAHASLSKCDTTLAMAPYLRRHIPLSTPLRTGRRLKACLRLGVHGLACVFHSPPNNTRSSHGPCKCQVPENVFHILGECPKYATIRQRAFTRIAKRLSGFASKSPSEKVCTLLSDSSPKKIDCEVYSFLFAVFQARAKLVDPTQPGLIAASRNRGF